MEHLKYIKNNYDLNSSRNQSPNSPNSPYSPSREVYSINTYNMENYKSENNRYDIYNNNKNLADNKYNLGNNSLVTPLGQNYLRNSYANKNTEHKTLNDKNIISKNFFDNIKLNKSSNVQPSENYDRLEKDSSKYHYTYGYPEVYINPNIKNCSEYKENFIDFENHYILNKKNSKIVYPIENYDYKNASNRINSIMSRYSIDDVPNNKFKNKYTNKSFKGFINNDRDYSYNLCNLDIDSKFIQYYLLNFQNLIQKSI